MNLTLLVWRQPRRRRTGSSTTYDAADDQSGHVLPGDAGRGERGADRNGREQPIAFDHDCREGICGSCGMMINGVAHGPAQGNRYLPAPHAELPGRRRDLVIEPWRARAFPVLKDLVVDRSALDRIIAAGGFVGVSTGSAPDANAVPVAKADADAAMDAAQCIGCGACVAACPNASAMLFTAAKAGHLGLLPQGQPERSPPGPGDGASRWTRRVRRLHLARRMSGGVSQGDQHRLDRPALSRLHRRRRHRAARRAERGRDLSRVRGARIARIGFAMLAAAGLFAAGARR